jgi:hypothetical protein
MTDTSPDRPARAPAPFWWPTERGWIIMGLFVLTAGILWVTKPALGAEPSEFFKAIAQATVLTGFLTACGFFFQASKGASDANARADKALDAAKAASPSPKAP